LGSIDITTLSEILSVLLYGKEDEIKNIYKEDTTLYPQKIQDKISKKVDRFFEETKEEKIRLKKFKPKKNESELEFVVSDTVEITSPSPQLDELIKIHSSKVGLGTKLNYYKP